MFCISKGLAAPIGSLLVGSGAFIARARAARKVLGGAMRQAGIMAAAGLYALDHADSQLTEDHANARLLADGVRRLAGLALDREEVQTNIFFVDMVTDAITPAQFVAALAERGVLVSAPRGQSRRLRLVTHYGVTSDGVRQALQIMGEILPAGGTEGGAGAVKITGIEITLFQPTWDDSCAARRHRPRHRLDG